MRKTFIIACILLPLLGLGQRMFKVDFIVNRVEIRKAGAGSYVPLTKTMLVAESDTIRTGKGSMVRLADTEGIQISINPNSTLNFDQLKETRQEIKILTGDSEFLVRNNKNFYVTTMSMVAGVRGTLFKVASTSAGQESVIVYEGQVEVTSKLSSGQGGLSVNAGQKFEWVPAREDFGPERISGAQTEELKFELSGNTPPPTLAQKDTQEISNFREARLMGDDELKEAPDKSKLGKTAKKSYNKPLARKAESDFFKMLFAAGGVKLDDYYYHSLVFAPEFKFGKWVTLGMYIPIYYDGKSSLTDVDQWGNKDEWSFSDGNDAVRDVLSKIRYLKIREKGDIFFLGLGNLNDITMGSGFTVDTFDMAPLFPSQRVVGIEGGFDIVSAGWYIFANDLYNPEIIGTRFYFRPLFGMPGLGKLEVALEFVFDRNPTGAESNPMFLAFGLNVLLPVVDNDTMSMVFFADIAKQGVYYKDWDTHPVPWADGTDLFGMHLNDNYGADIGFKGHFAKFILYGLRYYYLHSGYVASYMDRMYLVNRAAKIQQVLAPNLEDAHGIRLEAGFRLDRLLEFKLGFYKEFEGMDPQDRATMELKTQRGAFYKFWVHALYEKKYIDELFYGENYKVNAVMDIRIGYMISENADLIIRKLINYDQDGNQQTQMFLETSLIF